MWDESLIAYEIYFPIKTEGQFLVNKLVIPIIYDILLSHFYVLIMVLWKYQTKELL